MPTLYLILIAAVLVFGIGTVLWNRRRGAVPQAPAARPLPPQPKKPAPLTPSAPAAPKPEAAPVEADLPDAVEVDTVEETVEEYVRPSFRSRMSKARSTFTGALLGIAGRKGITPEAARTLNAAPGLVLTRAARGSQDEGCFAVATADGASRSAMFCGH